MAETSTKGPFYAKDSAGTMQKIKVIDLSGSLPETDDDLIAGYAYVEMTGSTLDTITGSYEKLVDISSSLANLDLSGLNSLTDIKTAIDSVTASVDSSTVFVEQLLRFNRATNIYSKVFKKIDLFNEISPNNPNTITLHTNPYLNPFSGMLEEENYFSKAVEVIIQNSTNKNLYLNISYNPAATLSADEYTIKIPPGVVYNSDAKLAHMRHKIKFDNTYDADIYNTIVGDVATSIAYNDSLNHDLSIGETTPGQPYITSIATNYFNMPFVNTNRYVVAEWTYTSGSTEGTYTNFSIKGQARVSDPGLSSQMLTLYVTNTDTNTKYMDKYVEIVDEQPVDFDLTYNLSLDGQAPPTGRYELIAQVSGTGDIGDARVLFADLIRRTG